MPASSSTILAIDSTLRRCSVALWQSQSVIAEAEETTPNRQAARLIPLIEQMLDKNKVNYSDISAIACTIGRRQPSGSASTSVSPIRIDSPIAVRFE